VGLEDVSVRRTFEALVALEVLRNRTLQIDIYLFTYFEINFSDCGNVKWYL